MPLVGKLHWVPRHASPGTTRRLQTNDSAYILVRAFRRLPNPGTIRPRVIKARAGTYLKDDSIERTEDDCG